MPIQESYIDQRFGLLMSPKYWKKISSKFLGTPKSAISRIVQCFGLVPQFWTCFVCKNGLKIKPTIHINH